MISEFNLTSKPGGMGLSNFSGLQSTSAFTHYVANICPFNRTEADTD